MSDLLAVLEGQADTDTRADKARYHKTERTVLGVRNPAINEAVAAFRRENDIAACLAEARALWSSGIFEARIAAGKLLVKARIKEPALEQEIWEQIKVWLPYLDGWAIADHLASAGDRRIMANLNRLDEVEGWAISEHLWTKRAAMTFTLPLAKLRHPSEAEVAARERVLGWATGYATDPEWFIQKAVAWWLRTLSERDADRTRAFMDQHGEAMKPFARKDATRKIP